MENAQNAELEAQIAKTPDDPAPYLVYADWLSEHGDPRGELIALSVKAEREPSDAIAARIAALHAAHDNDWVGPLAKDGVALTWRRGLIDAASIGGVSGEYETPDISHADTYAELAPRARLLRDLAFGGFEDDDGEPAWDGGVDALLAHGVPASLRRLAFERGGYWDISWTHLNNLPSVYGKLAGLETLYIALGHFDLGDIDLPALRDFEVYTGGFTSENLAAVRAAKWPRLERLILRFGGTSDYGADVEANDAIDFVSALALPSLRHLGLGNARWENDLIEPLARASILPQLKSVDLSLGLLDDAGAALLVRHADAFRHLDKLDLSESYLSADAYDQLKRAIPGTVAAGQRAGDDYRYCTIGE